MINIGDKICDQSIPTDTNEKSIGILSNKLSQSKSSAHTKPYLDMPKCR